ATIRIETQLSPEIFVLFDNARAPIHANLSATRSKVSVGITGKTGLNIGGAGAHTIEYNAGWGLPARFPACDAQMDREAEPSFAPYPTN
ncbi:MAG: hypothetical protein HYZ27_00210, partial [Deltaproteobacteria bacterium]|nr:hypothetical protein [Deltaproteobacteria bacterium]